MSQCNLEKFIYSISNQIPPQQVKITNIKLSFKSDEKVELDNNACLQYYKRYILIAKYDNFTYTFLGNNKSHVNITGINSIENVKTAIISLTYFSNLKLYNCSKFSIDNISTTFKTHPGLKEIILNIKDSNFYIFKPLRFCGIIIKYNNNNNNNNNNKFSLTYFNSGRVILVGLKNINDLNLCVRKYSTLFNYCKNLEK